MIGMLGHAGSVLVVASTRNEAHNLAKGLAEAGHERPALTATVDFVRGQLGDDHPLVETLRRGVGFHHAGLPTEVQEALEQAVRDDILPYLTCTSTLTDGINLPVRTVVIYDTPYEGQSEDVRWRGARLVNAIGRAGRAGKETEGWIVLTRAASPSESDFTDLNPDPDTLAVTSSLTTPEALQELAALEQQLRDNEDAIFRERGRATSNFISFVWLMLAVEEDRGAEPDTLDVADIVDSTLAAMQFPAARGRYLRVARVVQHQYQDADEAARRRWPRTGTSVGSARTLDHLASRIVATIVGRAQRGQDDDLNDPEFLLQFPVILQTLLDLAEAPTWRFRTSTHGTDIIVDPADVLRDWLHGVELAQLAENHLAEADTASWRIEQMLDTVTSHFEHFLSWTVGAVIELVNLQLGSHAVTQPLCPELGGYIRYGVDDPNALILMTSGIRSRRLAHTIARDLPDNLPSNPESLRNFLAPMGVVGWRDRYNATASEILDLLEFARLRRRSLLRALLENGTVDVDLPSLTRGGRFRRLAIEPQRDVAEPAPLAVYDGDELIATIGSQDHADINEILDTGVGTSLAVDARADPPTLTITLTLRDTQ
jgi:hypothetical protein